MNVLDENIGETQRRQLEAWKIRVRQIGIEVGRPGIDDRQEIIPLLQQLRRPTFFTGDHDFYHPWLRHPDYCLVYLNVSPEETARIIRRFLRHPDFRTHAQRLGKVVRVREDSLRYWQVNVAKPQTSGW